MALVAGNIISKEIADILGIKNCRSIDIHIALNEIVTVKAEFYPEIDGVKQLIPILREYELCDGYELSKRKATDADEEWKSL